MSRCLLFLLALTLGTTEAARCPSDAWAFYGAVRDRGGRPIADARLSFLLDDAALAFDEERGDRRVSFYSNNFGKYQAGLICDDNRDRPSPCARKPKKLTVATRADGYVDSLRVWKLKEFEIVVDEGICFIALPEIKLQKED